MVDIQESHGALRGREYNSAPADSATPAASSNLDIPVLVDREIQLANNEIVLCTEWDLPWLNFLCKKKYSNRYDSACTENWYRNVVLKSPMTFYSTRMSHSFQVSMLSVMPWLPAEPECIMLFVAADDGHMWQALRLCRDSIEWARKRRCTLWRLTSDTEADFQGIAKRLGCTEISPRYTIRF